MKRECAEALRGLERFLDGEMGSPERVQLDTHLHECSPCMQRADFKRHVKELVSSRCGCDEMPAGLKARVMQMMSGSPPGPSPDH